MRPTPPVVLTIAGFDPSSGAGVTADLQVFAAHGLFGTACLTAITVQSTLGVQAVEPLPPTLLADTLRCLHADLPAAGIKIGMLGSADAILAVSEFLRTLSPLPVVLDPVLRSTSGAALLAPDALDDLRRDLLPLCTIVTPNRHELAVLLGRAELSPAEIPTAAQELQQRIGGGELIVTGGDASAPDDFVLTATNGGTWLRGTHIPSSSTHGTGCAFSSALLSRLVLGCDTLEAATLAKRYVEGAIREAPPLGHGKGPLALLHPVARPAL